MCNPAAVLIIGAGAVQGLANEQSAEVSQEVAGINASMARWRKKDALARGDENARRHRLAVSGLIGKQRAQGGASGVALDSGTILEAQLQAAEYGELDALTIENNAAKEAFGYEVDAASATLAGQLYGNQKQAALGTGLLSSFALAYGSGALGGAGTTAATNSPTGSGIYSPGSE